MCKWSPNLCFSCTLEAPGCPTIIILHATSSASHLLPLSPSWKLPFSLSSTLCLLPHQIDRCPFPEPVLVSSQMWVLLLHMPFSQNWPASFSELGTPGGQGTCLALSWRKGLGARHSDGVSTSSRLPDLDGGLYHLGTCASQRCITTTRQPALSISN